VRVRDPTYPVAGSNEYSLGIGMFNRFWTRVRELEN
jgi:hypothetical protein